MKHTGVQKKALQTALLPADLSVSELSRSLGLNCHTVHRAILTFFEKAASFGVLYM
jgi:DNA-binding IclR family transcriptional regulator